MPKLSKALGFLLALSLGVTILPVAANEEEPASEYPSTLIAQEVENPDYSERISATPRKVIEQKSYADDDPVHVIVELLEDPVLADYVPKSLEDGGSEVAAYLAQKDVKKQKEKLIRKQEQLIGQIETLVEKQGGSAKVIVQWTTLVNAFTIEIPYKHLEEVKNLEGVKRAYISHVYDRPEQPAGVTDPDKKTHTYSLDQAGVESAWAAGFTGKGQLISVLDTGIDIIQDRTNGTVLGSHEAFSSNSFLNDWTSETEGWDLRYDEQSITKFLEETDLWANTSKDKKTHITYDNNALYKNEKVPFGFDYADWDVQTRPKSSDHGSHVAGTAAGFAANEEGEILFSGAAPDAQILAMKVFPDEDGGADEFAIVSALEDSLALGADVVNLSLGSDNGFANDESMQRDVFERLQQAGIVLMTSAGNSGTSTASNSYNSKTLNENPDISMVGSPSTYPTNVSVASMENTINANSYLTWSDGEESAEALFNDPNKTLAAKYAGKSIPVYKVEGVGQPEDYAAAGFASDKTGFALVQRGEIAFAEKVSNAIRFSRTNSRGERFGVLGVLIYDSNPESTNLITMQLSGAAMDGAFIGGKDGHAIAAALDAGKAVQIVLSDSMKTVESDDAWQMSSFTSWGAGAGLELKPEITAPGGNIWSAVAGTSSTDPDSYTGSYEMMSGTSMAAPHMSGITALVRQRVVSDPAFADLEALEQSHIINSLLVSTADPLKDPDGIYYSVRRQGAGLVDANDAIRSKAYLKTEGTLVPKLELKDDPQKTGVFSYSFEIVNTAEEEIEFSGKILLQTPKAVEEETVWGVRTLMAEQNEDLSEIDLGTIKVEKNSTVTVSGEIVLGEEQKAKLDSLYPNGIFVEGFVFLTSSDTEKTPSLGLPVLAYYGDWTAPSIFETKNWFDNDSGNFWEQETTWSEGVNLAGSYLVANGSVVGAFNIGQNLFYDGREEQGIYHRENFALSPDGNGYLDSIDEVALYQLRDARAIVMEVRDAKTNALYSRKTEGFIPKTQWSAAGYALPLSIHPSLDLGWDGTDLNGNVLPSGTKVNVTYTAYTDGDYSMLGTRFNEYYQKDEPNLDAIEPGVLEPSFNGHAQDKTGDVLSFPLTIDTEAPKLVNNALSFYEKEGRVYVKGTVYDKDGSLASVSVVPIVKRTYSPQSGGNPDYYQYGQDRKNPFYTTTIFDPETKTLTFEADVTEYEFVNESYPGEKNIYSHTWEGNILLSAGDYAANDRSYLVKADATEGIVLSQKRALLYTGSSFELSVNDNTGEEGELSRISTRPDVASIDEFGKITARAPGQTTIIVSKGDHAAICLVAVEDRPAEVIDFDLSIEKFDGLKPNGSVTVKVENLQPADVIIESNHWVFEESEEYANDYAAGLVTVEKNSADGLSGLVSMNVQGSTEVQLPAGSGTLSVSLNGVTRKVDISWADLYTERNQDDLVSNQSYQAQVLYTKPGETIQFGAKYQNKSLHNIGNVEAVLEGLVFDGPDFFYQDAPYSARLVNEERYTLPETVRVFIVYADGYERELTRDARYGGFTYDSTTGEVALAYAPTGKTSLRIEAQGIESPDAPAGELSGIAHPARPDGITGPFDWSILSGEGEIEPVTVTDRYGDAYEEVKFTTANAGVTYIQASTKEGVTPSYSLNFAVVSQAVQAQSLTVEDSITVKPGQQLEIAVDYEPAPTLEEDKALVWTSFAPEIVEVKEGKLLANKPGSALVIAALQNNTNVFRLIEVTVEQGADITLLNATIAYAKAKILEEQYQLVNETVKEVIETALQKAEAVQSDGEALQEQADAAWLELQNAVYLLNFTSNRADLAAAVEEWRPVYENIEEYAGPADSFVRSFEKAQAVLADPYSLDDSLNSALKQLEKSGKELVLKSSLLNKYLLELLVEHSNDVQAKLDTYVKEGQDEFVKALENARVVLGNAKEQSEIDAARNELHQRLLALRLKADEDLIRRLYAFVDRVEKLDRSLYSARALQVIDEAYEEIFAVLDSGIEIDILHGNALDETRKNALSIIAKAGLKEPEKAEDEKAEPAEKAQLEQKVEPETEETIQPETKEENAVLETKEQNTKTAAEKETEKTLTPAETPKLEKQETKEQEEKTAAQKQTVSPISQLPGRQDLLPSIKQADNSQKAESTEEKQTAARPAANSVRTSAQSGSTVFALLLGASAALLAGFSFFSKKRKTSE